MRDHFKAHLKLANRKGKTNLTTDFWAGQKNSKSRPTSLLKPRIWLLEPGWMNLSGLMTLSDVFSFWVDTIFQGSCNPQSLLHGEVDVLFDIPLIGLFKAV